MSYELFSFLSYNRDIFWVHIYIYHMHNIYIYIYIIYFLGYGTLTPSPVEATSATKFCHDR